MLVLTESHGPKPCEFPQFMARETVRYKISQWAQHCVALLSGVQWFAALKPQEELADFVVSYVFDF